MYTFKGKSMSQCGQITVNETGSPGGNGTTATYFKQNTRSLHGTETRDFRMEHWIFTSGS